jgi:hypothetical protein
MTQSEMKLFVVGETSGNPGEWNPWNPYRAIVVARNEEEARGLAEGSRSVAEIPLTRPVKLMVEELPGGF